MTQMYSNSGKNFNDSPDPYFEAFQLLYPQEAKVICDNADYHEVRPLRDDVDAAFKKNDAPFKYPDPSDVFYRTALEYVELYLAPLLEADVCIDEPLEFNCNSSAGIIGKKTGFPKTAEYLGSKPFKRYEDDVNHIPIQLVNDKNEFLCQSDLDRRKVRLVDCVDKTFLKKQKKLYQNQNENFLQNFRDYHIKSGFVKQYGGFDTLVCEFEDCKVISISDVSGYDKNAVLIDVYALRNKYLRIPKGVPFTEYYKQLIPYVTFYTLNPVRTLYDGTVVLQDHSNSSGQNNTTIDNGILHEIIAADVVIRAFYEVFDRIPSYQEFRDAYRLAIYSDDKVLGLRFDGMTASELKKIEIDTYAKYSMVIKQSASVVFDHPGGLFLKDPISFLGSDSLWCPEKDCYLPVPRVGKLCSSLCRRLSLLEEKHLDPEQNFAKSVMILSLLFGVDKTLQDAVRSYVLFLGDSFPQLAPQFYIFLGENGLSGLLSDELFDKTFDFLLTGRQSKGTESGSSRFHFFPAGEGSVVGFNSHMPRGKASKVVVLQNPGKSQKSKRKRARKQVAIVANTSKQPVNSKRAVKVMTGYGKYKPEEGKKYYKAYKAAKQGGSDNGWLGSLFDGIAKVAPHIIPLIAGFGDYNINMNSLLQEHNPEACATQVPEVKNSDNANIFRHREFLGTVLSTTTAFSVQTFDINPGLDDSFPWLAAVAAGFTSYRMRGLLYDFKSRATSYSATPSLGYVALATNYDALLPTFGSERELLNYQFATSCATDKDMVHPVECAKDKVVLPQLYLRTHAAPDPSDKRMYDLGKLNLAVGGQSTDGAVIGELWATFEIELLMPKLAKDSGKLVETDLVNFNGVSVNSLGTVSSHWTGATFTGVATTTSYTFPLNKKYGFYLMNYKYDITAAVISAPLFSFTNCATVSGLLNPEGNLPNATGTTTRVCNQQIIRLTGAGQASIGFTAGTPTAGSTIGSLLFTQLPDSMFPQSEFDNGNLKMSEEWFAPRPPPQKGVIFSHGDLYLPGPVEKCEPERINIKEEIVVEEKRIVDPIVTQEKRLRYLNLKLKTLDERFNVYLDRLNRLIGIPGDKRTVTESDSIICLEMKLSHIKHSSKLVEDEIDQILQESEGSSSDSEDTPDPEGPRDPGIPIGSCPMTGGIALTAVPSITHGYLAYTDAHIAAVAANPRWR
jgi:hypothetical protein